MNDCVALKNQANATVVSFHSWFILHDTLPSILSIASSLFIRSNTSEVFHESNDLKCVYGVESTQ